MQRINAHRHLFENETYADLIEEMDQHGVVRTVLMPLPRDLVFLDAPMLENAEVFDFAEAHPERLSATFYLDPRCPRAVEDLRHYAGRGAAGVKMWPPIGYYPDSPEFHRIYEEIERLGLTVLIHTGFTDVGLRGAPHAAANTKYAMPLELDALIRAFPGITWVYAHAGNPDFATAIQQAATHENVYLNINGRTDETGWDARLFPYYEKMQGACAALPWHKLVWGSDNIGFDFEGYDRVFESFGQAHQLASFYGDNARALFRL